MVPPMNKFWYLVAYDISHTRRLRRVFNILKAHGYALQNSVFLCQGTTKEIQQLYQQLRQELQADEDDLRMFPIASDWHLQFWGTFPLSADLHDTSWPAYKNLAVGQWAGRIAKLKKHFDGPAKRYA